MATTNETLRDLALQVRRYSDEVGSKVYRASEVVFGPAPTEATGGAERSDPPIEDILRGTLSRLSATENTLTILNDRLGSLTPDQPLPLGQRIAKIGTFQTDMRVSDTRAV